MTTTPRWNLSPSRHPGLPRLPRLPRLPGRARICPPTQMAPMGGGRAMPAVRTAASAPILATNPTGNHGDQVPATPAGTSRLRPSATRPRPRRMGTVHTARHLATAATCPLCVTAATCPLCATAATCLQYATAATCPPCATAAIFRRLAGVTQVRWWMTSRRRHGARRQATMTAVSLHAGGVQPTMSGPRT